MPLTDNPRHALLRQPTQETFLLMKHIELFNIMLPNRADVVAKTASRGKELCVRTALMQATAKAARQQSARLQQEAHALQQRLHSQKPPTLSQVRSRLVPLKDQITYCSIHHILHLTRCHENEPCQFLKGSISAARNQSRILGFARFPTYARSVALICASGSIFYELLTFAFLNTLQ